MSAAAPAADAHCGHRRIINGKEWVCILPPHPDPPTPPRKHLDYPPAPASERHGFVRCWPGTDH